MIDSTSTRIPQFKRTHVIRLGRLLNMRYSPAEIASEIGVSPDTVYRSYIPAGCPVERDDRGRLWIVGVEFRAWVQATIDRKRRSKKTSKCRDPNTAWCFRCNKCVQIVKAVQKRVNYHLELLQGKCALCGCKVNRARAAR